MAFDIQGARAAGYSDDEIADHLATLKGIDVAAARKSGWDTPSLMAELSSEWAKKSLPAGVNDSGLGGGRGVVNPPADGAMRESVRSQPGSGLAAAQPSGRRGTMRSGATPYVAPDPIITDDPLSNPAPAEMRQPLIEQRGAPVRPEVAEAARAQLAALPREQRIAQGLRTDIPAWMRSTVQAANRDISAADGLNPALGVQAPSLEARTARAMSQGADAPTARAAALGSALAGRPLNLPGARSLTADEIAVADARKQGEAAAGDNPIRAGLYSAGQGVQQGGAGVAAMVLQAFGDEKGAREFEQAGKVAKARADGAAELQQMKRRAAELGIVPQGLTDALGADGAAVVGVANSFGQMLPAMAAGAGTMMVTRNPGAAVNVASSIMGTQVAGQEYIAGREKGLNPGHAALRAATMGATEILFERFGLTPKIIGAFRTASADVPTAELPQKAAAFLKALSNRGIATMAKEVASENATTVTQYLVDGSPLGLNQPISVGELLEQMRDTTVQTMMLTGMMMAPGAVMNAGQRRDARSDAQPQPPATAPQQVIPPQQVVPPPAGAQPQAAQAVDNIVGTLRQAGALPQDAIPAADLVDGQDFTGLDAAAGTQAATAQTGASLDRLRDSPLSRNPRDEVLPVGDATEIDPIPVGQATEMIPTADAMELEAIPTGDATEIAPEVIQADDIMASDGEPFTSRTSAAAKAYSNGGGEVVRIPNHFGDGKPGFVVRPIVEARPTGTRGTDARDIAQRVQPAAAPDMAADTNRGANDGQGQEGRRQEVLTAPAANMPPDQTLQPVQGGANEVAAPTNNDRPMAAGQPVATDKPKKTKVYKNRGVADAARKAAGNTMKLQKVKNGYILRPKTDAEIEAEGKNAKRLTARKTIDVQRDPLLVAIAKNGGLAPTEKADTIGEGNKLTRGGHVFRGNGLPIDTMAEYLAEDGYIPPQEMERDGGTTWLRDAIKAEHMGTREHFSQRGEGWLEDRMAEMERQAQMDAEGDPFGPLADLTTEDLESSGYTQASPEVQALTEQLMADAEAAGIDTEAIRERVAMQNDGATADEYEAALQAAVRQALGQDRRGAEAGDARAEGAGNQDRGQADGGQEQGAGQGLTRQDRAALEAEYATRATEILQAISSRGDLPSLLRAGKARTADAFQSQPISDQAVAYADYIASGGKRVEFAESYNDRVRRLEREAATRRLQGDREIRQSNGKPFKTEASADQFRREYDLTSTHKVVPDGAGFMLRQLTMAEQDEAKRIADGRPTYEQAAAAVAADMGLTTNEDGEYNATDEQFAEYDRRITAILRGKEPMPAPKTAELLTTQTAEDLRAKAEREQAAAEAERAEQRRLAALAAAETRRKNKAEEEARAAQVRKERADAAVDSFELGQEAPSSVVTTAQAAGQQDVFADAPKIDTTAERVDAAPVAEQNAAPAADEPAKITEAEAHARFEWRNLGQRDNTTTHGLYFDGMQYGRVTLFKGDSRFQIDDGEPQLTLKKAKAEAERVAVGKLVRDGYVQEGAPFAKPAPDRDMLPPSTGSEAAESAKRKRPHGTIEFARPIVGKDGNRLLSYSWQWKPFEYVDSRGEERIARVSDWDNSETSAETGREVVHQFTVDVDGKLQTVSAEGALRLLGFMDGPQAAGFKSIASAAKTLARLKMQQAELQSAREAFDKAQAEVNALPLPPLPTKKQVVGKTEGWWVMGDAQARQLEPGPMTEERKRFLINNWRSNRLAERGWKRGGFQLDAFRAQEADLERRIARAQKKVDELTTAPAATQTEQPAPRSASTDAQAEPRAFDSEAFDRERAQRIKQSRDAGNTHLDQVPAYVETMRGRDVYSVHDTKVRGRILTVDTNGNVFVEWLDKYSQDKEGATPMRMGRREVMQSSLGPRDLKDYVLRQPVTDQPQDQPGTTGVGAGASRPVPAAQQAEPAAGLPLVTHTTAKGKVLEGYIVGVDKERAFELDKFTFRKDGGYFIRKARADELAPEVFAALPTPADAATAAQAAPATERQQQAAVEQAPEPKRQKTQVMRATAKRLIEAAQEDLGRDRNTNTARRAAMAGSAEADARKREAMGRTMLNLADAIDRGEAPLLEGITTRAQVETLDTLLTAAMYESDRGLSYVEQQRRKGRAPEPRDVANAKLPQPSWTSGGANKESLREAIKGKKGVREVERMLFGPPTAELLAAVKAMGVTQKQIDYAFGWWSQEAIARKQRLARAGINTDEDLRAALSQYIAHRDGPKAEDPIKAAERRLIGQKVGFDFFPTPAAVAQRMVQMADIKAGDRVLEPSAGNGNIADAARAAGGTVDAVEISSQLRDLLEAKGHSLVGSDFMAYEPAEKYDAIVMNPPFSNRLDAEHIRRAFGMLKPGGRLVAIAGEGVFNGSDTKAKAFRDWLDENGAEVEPLPPGTFKDAQLLAQTGANARMIVLSAPEAQAAKQDAPAAKMRTYSWDAVKLADAYTLEQLDTLRRQVQEQHANPGSSESGYTENGQPTLYLYDKAGRAKLDKIARAVTFKLQEAKAENAGGAMFSRAPAADPAKFPPVASLDGVSVGPMFVRPRPIAAGRQLYRETDIGGLDDLLRTEGEPGFLSVFVTDNRDLAIGQGDNRGVMVTFRPDSLSGAEHRKPGTGDTTGREYRTDLVAPRAVQSVTMPKAELKRLRGLTKLRLRDFDQVENADGTVTFNRKGLAAPDALFSRATGAGLPLADAQASVAAIREAMPSAPPIDVHATLEDAPAELQGIIRRAGAANDVEGVYWQGRIHVFPQHIASRERLEFVVGHHEVRHHGLAALLGDERVPLMRRLYATNKAVREAADAYLKANPFSDRATAVEEALADMPVERVQSLRGWQRIVAAIRDGLRRFAETIRPKLPGLAAAIEPAEWTDADITALVRRAEDVSRAPTQQSAAGMEPAPMFSRRPQRDDVTAEAPATDAIDPTMRRGWIDRIGRVQSAPGQALYNLIGRAASPLLLKTGLKAASPELRRMLRAMRLDVQKAQDVAVAVAREGTKLSDAERAMVSDIVEKEIAAGTIPPEHAVRLAEAMSAAMTRQSGELVSLGMLSDSAAQRWDGKYLPRYYESKLRPKVADAWADALMRITRRASPLKGIRGKHLKGRGLFETIPAGALQDYLDLGWEVRDDGYKPGQSAEVQVWRDFTREEREKMGEIRDAVFRFVMGYMQTQRDIALGRMFQTLALDERHSSRLPRDGWVKVPETVVEGTGVRRYGMLSGRYVPQEVLSHLSQIEETDSAAWQLYRRALGIWKMGKTVLNPVAHANNIISNLTMAHFGGVSYHRADKYVGAIRDIASRGKLFQEARENGLFLSTMSAAEMMNTMPDELQELAAKAESKTERGAKLVFDLMTWFLRKPMGKAYEAEDLFFRFLLYREARGGGMEPQDAVDYAQRYIFTYDDLPKGARMIRDFALPFFAYTYKAIPALLHTATVYPHRFIAPASVLWAANAIGYAIATGDDDDDWWETVQKYINDPEFRKKAQEKEELEREFLPPWQKGSSALLTPKAIRLGMDELTSLPLFLDASRMIPGGDLFDVSPNSGGLPLPQPLTPSHPLLTVATGMLGNRDLFTGKDLVDKNDDAGEAAAKRSDWLWKQASPAITINNYHWERLMQAAAHANGGPIEWVPDVIGGEATGVGRDGLPVQPKYAAAQTFGIKVRPFDQKRSQDMEAGKKAQLIRGIEAEMRQLERLGKIGALSPQSVFDKKSKLMDKRDKIRAGEPEEATQ